MGQSIIPMLQASGLYTLSAPWNTALLPSINYTCIGIRSLRELVAGGEDPFTLYYAPMGLTQAQYNTDLQNQVCMISLQASNNSMVYVPSSYIASFPDGGGVPYRVMLLSISLAAIPDTLNLYSITQKIEADVLDYIGVTSTVRSVAISPVMLLNQADAASTEAARLANITTSTTDAAALIAMTAKYTSAVQQINELESYIIAVSGGSAPPPPQIGTTGSVSSNPSGSGSSGAGSPTTLDPINLGLGLTLSNGNLTVSGSSAGNRVARSTQGQAITGNYYCEATVSALVNYVSFGLCNGGESLNGLLGVDTNGVSAFTQLTGLPGPGNGFYSDGVLNAGTAAQRYFAVISGTTVGMAVSFTAQKVWFWNPITNQWNGDVIANQNPAGSIGGISIATMVAAGFGPTLYPAVCVASAADVVEVNFGATPFANVMPTGFSAWNVLS